VLVVAVALMPTAHSQLSRLKELKERLAAKCRRGTCPKTKTSPGYSGTVTKNNQIATIANFGPEYRVAVDIMVHSASSVWNSILRFTSTGGDCCNVGDRIPAIFYNSGGHLLIESAVNERGNYGPTYGIDLEEWYHIEIFQTILNGKFYYIVNINGTEIINVENTKPRSFEDVKVFVGDYFYPASDATYKNLIWETNGNN